MRTIGIIGGIGPESTVEYYRFLVAFHRELSPGHVYPSVVINSIDVERMMAMITSGRLEETSRWFVDELKRLAAAGAELALIAANTAHVVFHDVQRVSPIPLVSIVETTRDAVLARGNTRVGLFGTRPTMQGTFYPDAFTPAGVTIVLPTPDEQTWIHDRYVGELVQGVFLRETRRGLCKIAQRLRDEERIQSLILGGTELPLILRDEGEVGLPLIDTSRIHARRIVELSLEP